MSHTHLATGPQRVLVLGGSGYIGGRWLARQLPFAGRPASFLAVGAARHVQPEPGRFVRLDLRDGRQLQQALAGMDAVVNCVDGSADTLVQGMQRLCEAALRQRVRIVHLSSTAVYGPFEGTVHESMPMDPRLGRHGQAQCEAEMRLREFVRAGGQAVVLRPGCVWGPGSQRWVGRMARWLRAGRLGHLGQAGQGWSNLVHVDDVGQAISRALRLPLHAGELPTFNLAAADSPRWNDYFADLARLLGVPLRPLRAWPLWLDSHSLSPLLAALQLLGRQAGLEARSWPDPMRPALVALWGRQIRLDTSAASRQLALSWTSYAQGLADAAGWLGTQRPWPRDKLAPHA